MGPEVHSPTWWGFCAVTELPRSGQLLTLPSQPLAGALVPSCSSLLQLGACISALLAKWSSQTFFHS